MSEFDVYIKNQSSLLVNWYRKHSLEHPAIKASFNSYIKEMKKEYLGALLSMDELIELME